MKKQFILSAKSQKGHINEALCALDKLNRRFQIKNPERLKEVYVAFYMELLVMISRTLIFQGVDPVMISEGKMCFLEMLIKIERQEDFVKWSCNMLILFMGMVTQEQNGFLSECVGNAVLYLQNNFRQSVTLKEVAEAVHVNPSYLSRTFKREFGINFSAYLTKLRLENAKHYLSNSQDNIKCISFESGFKSPTYFHTVFKKNTGVSPTDFRNIMSGDGTEGQI